MVPKRSCPNFAWGQERERHTTGRAIGKGMLRFGASLAVSVAVFPSQGEELFFLGGGFLVGFEEGLLWYACEHL